MTQLELSIAQQIGASAFLVYSVLKNKGTLTRRNLQMFCNLSDNCVKSTTEKLISYGIIKKELLSYEKTKYNIYILNDCFDWKLQ